MEYRYLFKAKRIDNGEWVQGNILLDIEKNKPSETYRIYPVDHVDICRIVDETTICQCTGLKDKNGKLIWENDISSYSDLITGDKKIICIEWNKMQASFVRKYRSPMGLQYIYIDEYIASRMEIIGNIFDNPELLESEG